MNTAQAIVQMLSHQGIDRLFCLPGVQNDPFFDALYERQDTIQPIHARHEQGTAYMALGAALATGKPQAYCVVPGPGFLNSTAALSTAYAANAKVLALVGQIPSNTIGKGYGLLHEIPDQLGMLKSLTKWATRIEHPDQAGPQTREAFRQMLNGRPPPSRPRMPDGPLDASRHDRARYLADPRRCPSHRRRFDSRGGS